MKPSHEVFKHVPAYEFLPFYFGRPAYLDAGQYSLTHHFGITSWNSKYNLDPRHFVTVHSRQFHRRGGDRLAIHAN